MVFENQFKSPTTILELAKADLSLFRKVHCKTPGTNERNQIVTEVMKWKPPTWPLLKANFDAAFDKKEERMGMGVVIRDNNGDLQATLVAPRDNIVSAFMAESVALLRAMELCQELGFNMVEFEGDAKAVVDAVKSSAEDNSWLGQATEDLKQVFSLFPLWQLSYVFRCCNKAAHEAAKVAIRSRSERVLLEKGLPECMAVVMSDKPCTTV
ncbi:hypothetical protein F2P56_032802 [Juglans regia]|uniref:Uncharacterized protein LOC108990313 n=2 Tax=Juglans regia TaxID=51240 RepID=A0A2I4EK54_JUGRE|nr:uncharacterized protein LOC108990313 [Juglans regia]KAF5447234.1 hypothetical protein F2P56_032802 [Juglans regia]